MLDVPRIASIFDAFVQRVVFEMNGCKTLLRTPDEEVVDHNPHYRRQGKA